MSSTRLHLSEPQAHKNKPAGQSWCMSQIVRKCNADMEFAPTLGDSPCPKNGPNPRWCQGPTSHSSKKGTVKSVCWKTTSHIPINTVEKDHASDNTAVLAGWYATITE